MSLEIDRDTIKAFILNELSLEAMSFVANAMLLDERLERIHKEEKLKIDAKFYRDNKVTPEQKAEFNSKLEASMKFFSKVKQQRETENSFDELLLKKQLERASRNYENSQKQRTVRIFPINNRFKHWLAAASILMLLITVGWVSYNFQPSDPLEDRLYEEYYTPLSQQDLYLFSNNALGIAKQKYMEGDYNNAILLLKDLPTFVNIEVERNLFIGFTLMEIGDFKVATSYFEEVLASRKELEYTPKIRWYLGLCYLKIGNRNKAIDTFQTIVEWNDYNYKKAKQILKKLRG